MRIGSISGSLQRLVNDTSYLVAGTNVTIVSGTNGQVTISSVGGGGGGPSGDQFFFSSTTGSIYSSGSAAFIGGGNEWGVVDSPIDKGTDVFFYVSGSIGSKDTIDPGTSLFGGDVVVSGSLFTEGDILEVTGTIAATLGFSGSLTTLTDGTSYLIAGTNVTIVSESNGAITISSTGGGGGPVGDQFFFSTTPGSVYSSGSLAFVGSGDEWGVVDSPVDKGTDVFFYVSGSTGSKDGPTPGVSLFGGDVVISGSLVAEGLLFEMTGTLSVTQGISGSLTTLTDGTSYLIAGNNISIVSQSNGSITISATASPVGGYFDSTVDGSIFTTGSTAFKGQESITSPADKGTDVFFYVSGSASGTGGDDKKSLFGGDVVISGSLFAQGSYLEMSGTLAVTEGISGSLTRLTDGTSYLIAGSNIIIVSQSNGSVTISATASPVDDYFDSTTAGSILTSGSTAFVGAGEFGVVDSPSDKGTDVFFYVSGSIGSKGAATPGVALFGGDVVISGSTLVEGNKMEITGTLEVTNGISGSLTKLSDGTSYLIAGNNISIVSQSNGSITISNMFVQVDDYFDSTVDGSIFTTGSAAFRGQESVSSPSNKGTDVFFYVSGSQGSRGGIIPGVALFGGDVVVSGSIFGQGDLFEMTGTLLVTQGISGSLTQLTDGTSYLIAGNNISITSQSNGSVVITGATQAPTDASYLVLGSNATLTSERTFTPGTGLLGTDGGANSSYTLMIDDNVVATLTGSTFSGVTSHNAGLSGSLTNLTDGSSYLKAGTNISITTGSNGAVTISNTFVQVDDYFDSTTDGSIFTTGSAAFRGGESTVDSPVDKGTDVFFYVSGSISATGIENKKSLFGGDVVISGSLNVKNNITLGDISSDAVTFNAQVASDVLPNVDSVYNLGSTTNRWANVYTGDLHLRNERGDWTLIEEDEFLTLRNNKTGRLFRLVMEPMDPQE